MTGQAKFLSYNRTYVVVIVIENDDRILCGKSVQYVVRS